MFMWNYESSLNSSKETTIGGVWNNFQSIRALWKQKRYKYHRQREKERERNCKRVKDFMRQIKLLFFFSLSYEIEVDVLSHFKWKIL